MRSVDAGVAWGDPWDRKAGVMKVNCDTRMMSQGVAVCNACMYSMYVWSCFVIMRAPKRNKQRNNNNITSAVVDKRYVDIMSYTSHI